MLIYLGFGSKKKRPEGLFFTSIGFTAYGQILIVLPPVPTVGLGPSANAC